MGGTHIHDSAKTGKTLLFSLGLTLLFVAAEALAGYWSHSLALLSDSGHNFSDALALLLSWYGVWMAKKPADGQRTFGYHRVGILAALFNALSLVVVAFLILLEAFHRFRSGVGEVQSGPMILVAAAAVLLNLFNALSIRKDSHHDLNIRSAYIHMLGDLFSALGVIVAGLVIRFTGSTLADPIASVLIGLLILKSSWEILNNAIQVLLEGIPEGMKMEEIEAAIRRVPGVLGVHDLHVWAVASQIRVCSFHIQVSEQSIRTGQKIMREITEMLSKQFHISHPTIQVEVENCEPGHIFCALEKPANAHPRGHSHR
jgi:cobalt-zinc-cadmium efflux system protein